MSERARVRASKRARACVSVPPVAAFHPESGRFVSEEPLRMWRVLLSGAVLFPGLFMAFRKTLPGIFRRWSDADVVLVSER